MTLTEYAKSLRTMSPLMEGREKIDTKDAKDQELTIYDFDIIEKPDEKPFAVVVFEEHPDKFLFAGSVLTDMLLSIQNKFPDARERLSTEPIRIRMFTTKAKSGNRYNYTNVEIVDIKE